MLRQGTSLRNAIIVIVSAASLSLPALSIAQAHQPADKASAARMHPKTHKRSQLGHRLIYAAVPTSPASYANAAGCTWPYRNMVPPCMSTWPEGDPNYHGSRPGVLVGQ